MIQMFNLFNRTVSPSRLWTYTRNCTLGIVTVLIGFTSPYATAQETGNCCEAVTPVFTRSECTDKFGQCCFDFSFNYNFLGDTLCIPQIASIRVLSGGSIASVTPYASYSLNGESFYAEDWQSTANFCVGMVCFETDGFITIEIEYWVNDFVAQETRLCRDTLTLCCNTEEGCSTDELTLDTGVAPWIIVQTPTAIPAEAYPAIPVPTVAGWEDPFPGTSWIAATDPASAADDGLYVFSRCFCVCEESAIQFDFSHRADDSMAVKINGQVIGWSSTGTDFDTDPAETVDVTVTLPSGRHCLEICVWNLHGGPMALNIAGSIISETNSLIDDDCCDGSVGLGSGGGASSGGSGETLQNNDQFNFVRPLDAAKFGQAPRPNDAINFHSIPNPTSDDATVYFTLAQSEKVELKVYDSMGQAVETLETGVRGQGTHSIVLRGSQLPAGAYFVRLSLASGASYSIPVTIAR